MSVYLNWADVDFNRWSNKTTEVLREILEDKDHKDFKMVAKSLEVLEDGELVEYWEESLESYEPIYNYIHPLEFNPEDKKVLEVALKTNCCIIYDEEEDKSYIALTGCGMDMSQDIALSYIICEKWIPEEFIGSVSTQKDLTIGGEDWKRLRKEVIEQCESYINCFNGLRADWGATKE